MCCACLCCVFVLFVVVVSLSLALLLLFLHLKQATHNKSTRFSLHFERDFCQFLSVYLTLSIVVSLFVSLSLALSLSRSPPPLYFSLFRFFSRSNPLCSLTHFNQASDAARRSWHAYRNVFACMRASVYIVWSLSYARNSLYTLAISLGMNEETREERERKQKQTLR